MTKPRVKRRRSAGPRIGLALAGGGPAGAVWEIGALRALEDCIPGLDVNTLHTYVGVSAGAFIGACLVNQMTPHQLAHAIVHTEPGEHPFSADIFFGPAYREWAKRAAKVPLLLAEVARDLSLGRRGGRRTDSLARLVAALPVGLFDNEPIRRYLERVFSIKGRTNDFRELGVPFTVVATDLETGHSVLFGRPGWDDVPIARAVQASTAVPGVYPPVLIEGRYCVDGVLLRTVHASIALSDGAELLFAINPIVPVDVTPAVERGEMRRGDIVRAGLPAVMSQTFRTLVHSRMTVGMGRYGRDYPNADVILLEPRTDDYAMFFSNIFSFRSRRIVCELAYRETRRDLYARRAELAPILARHGLKLDLAALRDPKRDVWGGVLFEEQPAEDVLDRLVVAVDRLEAAATSA